jgi:DNA mismatch repair protein MutS2
VDERALRILGFPEVRAELADRCATPFGARAARGLRPLAGAESIEGRLDLVEEALLGPAVSLGGLSDLPELLAVVRDGRPLDGPTLLQAAATLEAAATGRRAIAESGRRALTALVEPMADNTPWAREVRRCLDEHGEVRDEASPRLLQIRRRLAPLREEVKGALQEALRRHAREVQEAIITIRRDRYVIPVRADRAGQVHGLVLDESASGQTLYVEPAEVVPLNNELARLLAQEQDEVRRILFGLSAALADAPGIDEVAGVLERLDLAQAAARLAREWSCSRPEFGGRLRLLEARHPLVWNCVPNDIEAGGDHPMLVVTGPNMGGKTVTLKTVGLAALMAHSGLFILARAGSEVPRLDRILVDIGDEQSIQENLSTYSAHLTRLLEIIAGAGPGVLVLIDELGSGTDPSEGAALSEAILERLLDSGALVLASTHLDPVKAFAYTHSRVRNAAMEFDLERLAPTYRLRLGQPGRSYALAIAERLGMPGPVVARARDLTGPEGQRLESLLAGLERERGELQEALDDARRAAREARGETVAMAAERARLQAEEERFLKEASQRAEAVFEKAQRQVKRLRDEARSPQGRGRALEQLTALRREAARAGGPRRSGPAAAALEPGALVDVPAYSAHGRVLAVERGRVTVLLGGAKVVLAPDAVRLRDSEPASPYGFAAAPAAAPLEAGEVVLIGERVDVAIERLRDRLGEAAALGQGVIRIVHGKGTGALRRAVREFLKGERRVERIEFAAPNDGGDGVTIAHLRERA